MVCKECGAYNADHLTHCRVCAAKLKDTEPDTAQTAQEPGRPARRFAQAPAWPKQAFAGAEESQTAAAPAAAQKTDEPTKAEPAQEQPAEKRQPVAQQPRPEAQPAAAPAEPAAPKVVERPAAKPVEKQQSVCAHCGKPLLPLLFSQKTIDRYSRWAEEKDRFSRLFALAIFLPVAPDDFLCYLAGTTDMTWRRYTAIILLGKPFAISLYSLGLTAIWQMITGA